jgi:excisionase family DNA binding protein
VVTLSKMAVDREAPGGADDPSPGRVVGAHSIGAGQVFADILLLGALACRAPFALVSVPQPGGQWSTLSHGFELRVGLNDRRLFDVIAARRGPVEIPDLASTPGLSGCPLAGPPHEISWAYGAALRSPSDAVLGVVAVLDRGTREPSRRDRRAMLAVCRQMTGHLTQLRKVASIPGAWIPLSERDPDGSASAPRHEPGGQNAGRRLAASLMEGQQLLRSHEVAVLFDVTERTVINWASAGKLPSLRTIGGHLRFRSEDVVELLAGRSFPARPAPTAS